MGSRITKVVTLLVFGGFFQAGCTPEQIHIKGSESVSQSYIVYQKRGATIVRGQIDHKDIGAFDKSCHAIQFAIDSLPEQGGEVILQGGKFLLQSQINLKSNVSLKGSGPGTVLWIGEEHETGIAILCSELDRTVISNLSIKAAGENENAKAGILLKHCGDCQVRDVFCLGLKNHGIWLKDNCFLCEVRGCKLAEIDRSAICLERLDRDGRGGDYVPNLITNCIVYGGGKGIECNRSLVVNIVGCQVYQTRGPAFHIRNTSNSVVISGCRSFQIQDDAVVVEDSHEINLSSNIFCWQEGHGIVLKNVTWGTVTGNNVIDSGSLNIEDEDQEWTYLVKTPEELDWDKHIKNGINMIGDTKGLSITGNAVFNWGNVLPMDYGIYEDSSCGNNIVTGNNINYCRTAGVLMQGESSKEANNFSEIDYSYYGTQTEFLHRFDTRRIRKFIEEQR